jgi:gamma-glutamylcyclotransferase (GGCT)/AIG2-like uncharacterized protein YtfP
MIASPAEIRLLFVYGTLRNNPSHEMYNVLKRYGSFIGEATVPGFLYDLGSYPGMVQSNDQKSIVTGELYNFSPHSWKTAIAILDDYEECGPNNPEPHEYHRAIVTAKTKDDMTHRVWTYLYLKPIDKLRPILSGDYFKK